MRQHRLYLNQALTINSVIKISDDRAHYLKHVLRLSEQQQVILFNGDGYEYQASINKINKQNLELSIYDKEQVDKESPIIIELAIVLVKGERLDFAIQKAVELGVSTITLLNSEYGSIKLKSERLAHKLKHWQGVVSSAAEQCGRTVLPELNYQASFSEYLKTSSSELKLVLHPYITSSEQVQDPEHNIAGHIQQAWNRLGNKQKPLSISLLIGPEGGFSEQEVQEAMQQQFQPMILGSRILRTETAAVTAISLLQYLYGDLNRLKA